MSSFAALSIVFSFPRFARECIPGTLRVLVSPRPSLSSAVRATEAMDNRGPPSPGPVPRPPKKKRRHRLQGADHDEIQTYHSTRLPCKTPRLKSVQKALPGGAQERIDESEKSESAISAAGGRNMILKKGTSCVRKIGLSSGFHRPREGSFGSNKLLPRRKAWKKANGWSFR